MGKQLLKANQVTGINNITLYEDLLELLEKTKYYGNPVTTKTELPLENNVDGEIRLVLDESTFYVWHSIVNSWRAKTVASTERRLTNVVVGTDSQTDFTTTLPVGVVDGISDLESIVLLVNGLTQYPNSDYSLSMDDQVPPRLTISWKSSDFQLEKDDMVAILYDILKMR